MKTVLYRSLCLVLAAATLSACRDTVAPTTSDPDAAALKGAAVPRASADPDRSAEAHGPRIAQQVPEFGGWYFDQNGDLNVWVRNPEVHGPRARAAVAAVAAEMGLIPAKPDYKIIIRQGRFVWQELSEWRGRIEQSAVRIDGVTWVDLDERANRVAVGVNSGLARAEMKKHARELGIPAGALMTSPGEYCTVENPDCNDPCTVDPASCEDPCTVDPGSCQDPCSVDPSDPACTTDPCEANFSEPACQPGPDDEWSGGEINAPASGALPGVTLNSEFSVLRGGIRIAGSTRQGTTSCTLGAVAHSPTHGRVFVTNSHCTYDQGGVRTGTALDFYQHVRSAPLFVGTEVLDPSYVRPSGCAWHEYLSKSCYLRRNSDAAAIRIENRGSERGTIARPANRMLEGEGPGTIQVDASRPVLRIVRDQVTPGYSIIVAQGNRVDKIGSTTGWTSGRVQSVCRTEYQTSPNRRQHTCQNTVNYTNDAGDSGGPVFYLASEAAGEVWLLGIHHTKKATYSPLTQVAKDLPGLVYH